MSIPLAMVRVPCRPNRMDGKVHGPAMHVCNTSRPMTSCVDELLTAAN
jgi:hypothetical protein